MSGVDELLGRLETTAVRYSIGRGGIPELTPQDIAAALAIGGDRFAATVYQAVCGGGVDWPEVDRVIALAQFNEWRSRMDRLVDAQLLHASVDFAPRGERVDRKQFAELRLAGARAAMWPALVEDIYAKVRRGVLAELRSSRTCPACNGRGSVQIESVIAECKHCVATGRVSISDRQRATMVGVSHTAYLRTWRPVYDWMYRMLTDAVSRGRHQFSQALGRVEF